MGRRGRLGASRRGGGGRGFVGIGTFFFFFFLPFFFFKKEGGFYGYVSFMMGREGRSVRFFFLDGGGGIWGILDVWCGLCVSGAAQVGRLDRRM